MHSQLKSYGVGLAAVGLAVLLRWALTAWGQEDDRRKSQEAGFDAHLVKPVDYDELLQCWVRLRMSVYESE